MTPEQIRERLRDILREHQPRDASQLLLDIEQLVTEAVRAEHERITQMAEAIEQGAYTTTKTVSQVLRSEPQ